LIRLLAIALVGLVAWLSLTPKPPSLPGLPESSDLAVHLAMHLAMAGTLLLGWPGAGRIALAIVLAVALEVAQFGIVGRHFSVADLLANLIGAGLGCGLASAYGRFIPQRLR
jgi:hypothetical protein